MFSGNQYGTSQSAIQDVLDTGRMCVLDIEISGVQAIRQTELDPRYVFISPPSVDALENRLRLRGTETKASLLRRLAAAKREMEYGAQPGNFDITIVNDNLDNAYEELKLFVLPDMRKLEPSGIKFFVANPPFNPQNAKGGGFQCGFLASSQKIFRHSVNRSRKYDIKRVVEFISVDMF